MFGFSFGQLVFLVLYTGVVGYVGVMLGRRSKTANAAVDLINAQIDEVKARTRATLKSNHLE